MELLTRPTLEFVNCCDDIKIIKEFLDYVEVIYNTSKELNLTSVFDLELFLKYLENYGKKFNKYYLFIHSKYGKTSRPDNFRKAMREIIKYCSQIANFIYFKFPPSDKLIYSKLRYLYEMLLASGDNIKEEYCTLPNYKGETYRILKIIIYWYFPQGSTGSDNEMD